MTKKGGVVANIKAPVDLRGKNALRKKGFEGVKPTKEESMRRKVRKAAKSKGLKETRTATFFIGGSGVFKPTKKSREEKSMAALRRLSAGIKARKRDRDKK